MITIDEDFLQACALSTVNQEHFATLLELLEKQADKVIALRLLPNFGKDYDLSLSFDTTVLKGFQLQLRPEYVTSDEDIMWMNPNLYHMRTTVKIGATTRVPTDVDLVNFNNRVGTYETTIVDEFGMKSNGYYAVLDTTPSQNFFGISQGEVLGDLYIRLKDFRIREMLEKEQEAFIKMHFNGTPVINSCIYNVLNSNGDSIAFYNDCTATKCGECYLVNKGPIHGYLSIKSNQVAENVFKNVLPLSLGTTNEFYKWKDLTEVHREKFMAINWGKEPCSTSLMRIPTRLNTLQTEEWAKHLSVCIVGQYCMNSLIMAPHHVSDKIPVKQLVDITPSARDVVDSVSTNKHFYGMYRSSEICVPFRIDSELVAGILRDHLKIEKEFGIAILNPKICKEGLLYIPRELINNYID